MGESQTWKFFSPFQVLYALQEEQQSLHQGIVSPLLRRRREQGEGAGGRGKLRRVVHLQSDLSCVNIGGFDNTETHGNIEAFASFDDLLKSDDFDAGILGIPERVATSRIYKSLCLRPIFTPDIVINLVIVAFGVEGESM